MSETVLVTGATGLIGANVAQQLVAAGDRVRALTRPRSETEPLRRLGVEIVEGDITDAGAVAAAARHVDAVVHSAAVLGGASQDPDEHRRVNIGGAINVLDAATAAGCRRVVVLSTSTFFDYTDAPLTESSPLAPDPPGDPYTQSKRAAYVEVMRRARAGMDVCAVLPGGTFGPSPVPNRALEAPSYNLRLLQALRGALGPQARFPIPWSYAPDVAAGIRGALERGRPGETYLTYNGADSVSSVATFLNRGLELAASPHRVTELDPGDPDLEAVVGPTLAALARRRFPSPFFVNDLTRRRLGFEPHPLDDALAETVDWLTLTFGAGGSRAG